MKKFASVAKVLVVAVSIISFAGCFQYPDGPVFTLQTRAERLNGTWTLTSATDSLGNDVTSEFQSRTITAVASRSNESNTWSIFDSGSLISQGLFTFATSSDLLVVVYTLLDGNKQDTQILYTITKLTDKYFHYTDPYGFKFEYKKY